MGTNRGQAKLKATLNLQRRDALTRGGAFDHAGRVHVERMANFDMGRTIFGGLTGPARMFMTEKLTKEPVWSNDDAAAINVAYDELETADPSPPLDQRLVDFMVEECDFSMEHADGTFLEHLVFCHDYSARYYPEHSPNVALLHSILGTATNTFAMDSAKIPELNELLTDFEALHVSAFPSVLRLLYNDGLLDELEANLHRLDQLGAVHMHRVIDNEPIMLDAENLWINLNYHLMHLVDFMPAANWSHHRGDPLMQLFDRLERLLDRAGQRQAQVAFAYPKMKTPAVQESLSVVGTIVGLLPARVTLKLARKSIREYSQKCGHSMDYSIDWS